MFIHLSKEGERRLLAIEELRMVITTHPAGIISNTDMQIQARMSTDAPLITTSQTSAIHTSLTSFITATQSIVTLADLALQTYIITLILTQIVPHLRRNEPQRITLPIPVRHRQRCPRCIDLHIHTRCTVPYQTQLRSECQPAEQIRTQRHGCLSTITHVPSSPRTALLTLLSMYPMQFLDRNYTILSRHGMLCTHSHGRNHQYHQQIVSQKSHVQKISRPKKVQPYTNLAQIYAKFPFLRLSTPLILTKILILPLTPLISSSPT